MCVWRSIFTYQIVGRFCETPINRRLAQTPYNSERLDRLGLRDFGAAVFAGAPLVVLPKIEHCLAEMLDDVPAIEIDVLDDRAALFAVKNDVLVLAGGATTFHDDAHRIGR